MYPGVGYFFSNTHLPVEFRGCGGRKDSGSMELRVPHFPGPPMGAVDE